MTEASRSAEGCTITLPAARPDDPAGGASPPRGQTLPGEFLVGNVHWFCHLRWVVAVSLAGFGVLSLISATAGKLALRQGMLWPFGIAVTLAVANVWFILLSRRSEGAAAARRAIMSLWAQVVTDLLVLTVVVHHLGTLRSYAPFAYLFHVVLACIFLSRRQSLIVLLLACTMYSGCILLEHTSLTRPQTIFAGLTAGQRGFLPAPEAALNFATALATMVVVWYLACHLAEMVRNRDAVLAHTNQRLLAARQERSRHMLRTTHELKAPFAAIHANAQLLLEGYCGALPDKAAHVAGRIAARCKRLAREIQEMLQLANLHSAGQHPPEPQWMDLSEVVAWCITQVQGPAEERDIRIELELEAANVYAIPDHMKMLLGNIINNAVTYSRPHGTVRIACDGQVETGHRVAVSDDGIGISRGKLSRIFDEYYRTEEAVQHNPESSGLGLSIVRTVARAGGIGITYTSRPGDGTTCSLQFPPQTADAAPAPPKEMHHGLPADCR